MAENDVIVHTPDGFAMMMHAEINGTVTCADPCVPECTRHGQTEGEE
jgi:hypothetical protein